MSVAFIAYITNAGAGYMRTAPGLASAVRTRQHGAKRESPLDYGDVIARIQLGEQRRDAEELVARFLSFVEIGDAPPASEDVFFSGAADEEASSARVSSRACRAAVWDG